MNSSRSVPVDRPILGLLDDDHRTHCAHGIKEIHLSHPFALPNRAKQDFAIRVATNSMKHAADNEEQPSVRFSLRNQYLSMIRQMKIAIRTENTSVFLRKCRDWSHRRKIRSVKFFKHALHPIRPPRQRPQFSNLTVRMGSERHDRASSTHWTSALTACFSVSSA